MSTYYFLPWVRSGMAQLLTTPTLGKGSLPEVASGRIPIPVTFTLKAKKTDGATSQQAVKPKDNETSRDGDPPQLYGPGDVVGIDVREIIRTGPLHLTPDYPPERFAFIEFDRPDFPWLFTPGGPDETGCLRPWLVLVVVEKSKATITSPTDNRLPVLSCPVTELPHRKEPPDKEPPDKVVTDLEESWAWAHGVYAGKVIDDISPNRPKAETIGVLLQSDPQDRNLSRLLCPRKLKAHTPYEACLVPAFMAGVKAGLGLEFNSEQETLAHWKFEKDDEVKLPVYYHWSFSTGDENQFIKLAEQLQPLSKDEKTAALEGIAGDMDISNPGNGMKASQIKLTTSIPSALRISPGTPSTSTNDLPSDFDQDALQTVLTSPSEMKDGSMPLPLPTYGSWHAPPADLSTQLDSPGWLKTLNLDPRYRVAAALGTSIIQKEQEHIIAAVWKEVGKLQAANELLQRKQLACCVTDSIHKKRLSTLSPAAFAQVCSQIAPSILAAPRAEAAQAAGPSNVPPPPSGLVMIQDATNSPQFRRMTRGGGSWAMKGSLSGYDPDHIAPPPGVREGDRPVSKNSSSQALSLVAKAAGTDVSYLLRLKQERLAQTDPRKTFAEEVAHRVRRPSQPQLKKAGSQEERYHQHGELGPFTYAPSFSTPMYEPLRDQFPEMLLPGLHKIPNDRATRLDTDAPFIEAYMVGLNHELSREFLWREFPTMLNVTFFRQFWEVGGARNSQSPDISKPINDWETRSDLGTHLAEGRGGDLTFLLIRSELIVRYPNALIYARNGTDLLLPFPRFSPIAGVALLGFNIPDLTGWRFFVEEHFTEPYMGPKPELPDNVYVSFSHHKNSAEVAKEILKERYFREIHVT